ncbi:MAG: four helix bundle protein [Candidatus Pacebacteria bacterium]|nr:four helix bundle protein [Candidatus Paceibacterota bacterium]
MFQNLLIFQKIYDFMVYCDTLIVKFPKTKKYILGGEITKNCLLCLRYVVEINLNKQDLVLAKKLDTQLNYLRILIRFAKDVRCISLRQYDICCDKMCEIMRLMKG